MRASRFDISAGRYVDKANSKTFAFNFASFLFIAISNW